MKELLIFAGTTEGRKLSECLAASEIVHTVCVATEYGEIVLKENPFVKVHQGRMKQEEIRDFILQGDYQAVIDATHPYADVITDNIRIAMDAIPIPYFRLKRENDKSKKTGRVRSFDTHDACAKALEKVEGNILLTTGSKELSNYCTSEQLKNRLYVRVLPSVESITLCMEQGIYGKQILAMQGPFSVELNEALIRQYQISCLVTKESGISGGYLEKLKAAEKTGITVFKVEHPKDEEGFSFSEVCKELELLYNRKLSHNAQMEIILAGIGMGTNKNMTREVQDAIQDADILLGAERMLACYEPRIEKRPYYQEKQIIPYLKEMQEKNIFMESRKVVILFSGDSGFYSGCQSLYEALQVEIKDQRLQATIQTIPGISSVAYLASCIGESYQYAAIYSMHGKKLLNLASRIKKEEKTYLLMSGVTDVNRLGEALLQAGMQECKIVAGYQLSYPQQQIRILTPKECCLVKEEGLYTCLVKNPNAICRKLTHGMADDGFIRDKVPMTKEEIREVSICKLRLCKNAIVYDIGSGTGSVAVEIASLSDDIKVYAIEQKEVAVSLIEKNKNKCLLENIEVIRGQAPEGFCNLPIPTHVFIGGSGGKLKDILSSLYQLNPTMRIVINAISMETISEISELLSYYKIEEEEIVQLQVNRTKQVGRYRLMQAENPVWICAFRFVPEANVMEEKL